MRALDRKLLRDLWHIKGQALAVSLVIAAGVTMFIMFLSAFDSLRLTQSAYYERYRFADVFATVKRAPLRLRDRIADLPGVAAVETRVVVDVTLDVEGLAEPATGRLISIPDERRPMLNDIVIRRGRYIDANRPDEVLVNEAFAAAHRLDLGDTVRAIINGRRRELEIVGIALTPEYIYTTRPGELIPDDTRFGLFWMERRALAAAFDMEGGFNDVALALMPGAVEQAVIADLDRLLQPYGGFGALPRSFQLSHWSIDNELNALQGVGIFVPIIFMGVAGFLLNVMLTRIVSVQREEIAALKALGYSRRTIGAHYAEWALAIGIAGSIVGTIGGASMGRAMVTLYNQFFRFPILQYRLLPPVILGASLISVVTALAGCAFAVRRAVRLPPAEAMRPQAPPRYHLSWLERLGAQRFLSQPARMILRNVQRHPVRSLTSVVGIAFSVAMLVVGTFQIGAIDVLMDVQFGLAQRQDVTISFVEPLSAGAWYELQRLPGVIDLEPVRSVPVRLRAGTRSRQLAIQGLKAEPRLNRVLDVQTLQGIGLPAGGLVVSETLAAALAIQRGDVVTVEVLEGRRPVRRVAVADVVEQFMGVAAYMQVDALRDLLREGGTLSGGFLTVDEARADTLYETLKATPAVAGVTLQGAAIESFQETFAQNIYTMIAFFVLFASIIAGGVVYNTARVSLSERSRELASLRVMGFTRREISAILLGELAVLTLVAIPPGLLLGYGFAAVIVQISSTELYSFPLVVSAPTFAFSSITVMVAATLSGLLVRRKLDRLDLVEVLKTRE